MNQRTSDETSSAYDLVEKGLFLDAARQIDRLVDPPVELVVLRTQLERQVGSPPKAAADAKQLLRRSLAARERSICWEVVGRVALRIGQTADGLRAMNLAISEAAQLHDGRRECRLFASYVAGLLSDAIVEGAMLEMTKLRQSALRSGDPFSLIEFHTIDAEIKIRRGALASAAAPIAIARALINQFPNVAQQGRLAVSASGLAIMQGDFTSAAAEAVEALSCGRLSGWNNVVNPALNNLAYAKLALRQFEGLQQILDEFYSSVLRAGQSDIAILDTQMVFALAADDVTSATALARQISEQTAKPEFRTAYYTLWHAPTRIRWLLRIGEPHEAARLALETIPAARRLDPGLVARLKLLAADAFGRTGQTNRANTLVVEALCSESLQSLELVAEGLRVTGRLAAAQDPNAAAVHFQRAGNLLASLGNLSAQSDVGRDANETLGPSASNAESISASSLSRITERLGTLVELGAHVPTLASEALSAIQDTAAAFHATLSRTDPHGQSETLSSFLSSDCPRTSDTDAFRIDFGLHRERHFQITCLPRAEPTAVSTLIAIDRLVKAALAMARGHQLEREHAAAWTENSAEQQLGLVYSSERMLDLVKTIRRVASSNATVLLTGETGVGKELFARALHQASRRSAQQFLPFNCSTVPREMLDSQLFGHKRGSFTGAQQDSLGMIRSAAGGTLFLDEIGEMAIDAQPKLLRFLESGEIMPLGDPKPHIVDVRVVAATNANLDALVAEGRFREDLYYRLNVIRINIPPLRERREEIPALVGHFLQRFGDELHKPLLRIADETLEYLVLYRWPGNVRQLANEIRRLVAMAETGSVIMPAHLASDIAESRRTLPANRSPRLFDEVVARIDQPLSAVVEHVERAAIQRALAMTDGHLDEAARMLGLSRKGLYLKRQRLNLG